MSFSPSKARIFVAIKIEGRVYTNELVGSNLRKYGKVSFIADDQNFKGEIRNVYSLQQFVPNFTFLANLVNQSPNNQVFMLSKHIIGGSQVIGSLKG